MRLSLLTYNIRLGVETDLRAVATAIAAAGAFDLIALQEVGEHWNMGERVDQAAVLAAHLSLPTHVFAGALTDAQGGRYGIAVLARWPMDDIEVINLPREVDEQRVLLRATLRAPVPVRVYSTHLSIAEAERTAQARFIADALAEEVGPVLLLGDLNDRPESATLAVLNGLIDCFDACGEGASETFSVRDPHRRIDYIRCGGGLVPAGTTQVLRAARASDHFPLRAFVQIEAAPA
ncbi:MAG: endonuclease/exonuclease/phosphatase family protein [Myxococcales bacterium]|nr:endonuclease/exonuclease/phosphatase family protein [Myxococcales bacterium]